MAKPQRIRDVMTPNPLTLESTSTIADAARAMKIAEIGPVPVIDDRGHICGIVTDRDIVVRGLAEGRDPTTTPVGDVCSTELVVVSPDDTVDDAVTLMRDRAVRRLPVVEDGRAVGIVAIGDLARVRDEKSPLADISSAPANV